MLRQHRLLEGRSFNVFAADWPPRVFAFHLVQHPLFEALVLVVIIVNCILLAADDASVAPDSAFSLAMPSIDIAFGVFFASEMALKLLAWGLWANGQTYVPSCLLLGSGCGCALYSQS